MADSDRSGGEKLKDRLLKLWDLSVDRARIFGTGALSLALVLVGLLFLVDWSPNTSAANAADVVKWVERLPTNLGLYLLIAALVVVYLGWRWHFYARLNEEFDSERGESKGRNNLTSRDWWVARELRRRAFALRMRADALFATAIALLFGGVYLVLFAVPQIARNDQLVIQQIIRETSFQERFDETLKLISEGRYWFKVNEVSLPDGRTSTRWGGNTSPLFQLGVDENIKERNKQLQA